MKLNYVLLNWLHNLIFLYSKWTCSLFLLALLSLTTAGFIYYYSPSIVFAQNFSLTNTSNDNINNNVSKVNIVDSEDTKNRTYYIAADQVLWNYTPSGINNITGKPFDTKEKKFTDITDKQIGSQYTKAVYNEYTNNTFSALKPIQNEWKHLGILGPVIRGEVGDTITVVFKNNLDRPVSMHPHGVFYLKDSEGAPYADNANKSIINKEDDAVPPGKTHVYTWLVPERAGPGPSDPSSIVWEYHSHTNETADENSGLIGPILITKKGMAKPDGSPKDVDKEFVLLYMIFDENKSPYLNKNIVDFAKKPQPVNTSDPMFKSSNMKHAINGYLYGNLPALDMKTGDKIRWYVMGAGGTNDTHTSHWHGNTLLWNNMRVDTIDVHPAIVKTLDMIADDSGIWLLHCHVNDHLDNGMVALYKVAKS